MPRPSGTMPRGHARTASEPPMVLVTSTRGPPPAPQPDDERTCIGTHEKQPSASVLAEKQPLGAPTQRKHARRMSAPPRLSDMTTLRADLSATPTGASDPEPVASSAGAAGIGSVLASLFKGRRNSESKKTPASRGLAFPQFMDDEPDVSEGESPSHPVLQPASSFPHPASARPHA